MVKFLLSILLALVAVATALLAVANRQPVTFRLDPLPFEVELPLFLFLLVGIFVGIFLGGFSTWAAGGRYRRLGRQRRHAIAALEREVARLKQQAGTAKTQSRPLLPGKGDSI